MYFNRNIVLLFIGLLMQIGIVARAQTYSEITFIGNGLGIRSLSEQQVFDYFKAKKNLWPSNKAVIVCLPATHSQESVEICSKLYGKTVNDVQKFWLAEVFKGRSRPPYFGDSDEDIIDYVKKNPGAIAAFINERGLTIPPDFQLQITK